LRRIGEPRKAAHVHPHREVLTLEVRRADVARVRVALRDLAVHAGVPRWAVSRFILGVFSVELLEHRVIDIGAKRVINGVQIRLVGVRRQPYAVLQACATSCMNVHAEPASRPATSHDRHSLLSASIAVDVHTSPPSGCAFSIVGVTFFFFA
jgi:hypothetical protein